MTIQCYLQVQFYPCFHQKIVKDDAKLLKQQLLDDSL